MIIRLLSIALLSLLISCCAHTPDPAHRNNVCKIFQHQQDWFDDAEDAENKWGTPIQVMMAIMYQESSFRPNAQPERKWYLGFIPGSRPSSAYGYAQAQDPVWQDYIRETDNSGADRDDFDDAIDFIGWFTWKTRKINGASLWFADKQYLNYHEGWSGYRKGTYKKKPWLVATAKKVKKRASTYGQQLKGCREDLESSWFF
jgi:hypothetical protein